MTKGEFATLVRAVKNATPEYISEQVLNDLSSDLHYVAVLAFAFPEQELRELEAASKEYFW